MDLKTARKLKAKLVKLAADPEEIYRRWRFGMPKQADPSLLARASARMAAGPSESTTAADVYPAHVGSPGPVVRRAGAHLVDLAAIQRPKKRRKRAAEDRGPGFPEVPIHPWAALARRFPGTFR